MPPSVDINNTELPASIYKKTAVGSFYNIAVSGGTLVLGFTRTILLMRLLGAETFGTIALALFFSKLVLPFSSFGLDHALIQQRAPQPVSFSTHFILRIGFSLAIIIFCLLVSPFLRLVYNDQLVNIVLILLVINLLDSIYATHYVILRREMRYGPLAVVNISASLLMTVITPIAAYLGAGIWSLVLEQAIGSFVRWTATWIIIRPWKISFRLSVSEARSHLSFGSRVVSGNLLGTILDRFDDFWIGTTLGATALGFYSRAYELTQYPERILSSPITNVFMSAYASVQDKSNELSKLFFRSSCFLVRAGLLISAVMATVTPELVTILFTPKWLSIVPIFRLMTIYIIFDPIYNNLSTLLVSIGQPRLLNSVRLIQVGIFILAVITLAELWGTNGVAIAANLMMLAGIIFLTIKSRDFLHFNLRRMWLGPIVAAVSACLLGYFAVGKLQFDSTFLTLVVKTASVAIIYALMLVFFEFRDVRRFGLATIKPILENAIRYYHAGKNQDK